MGKLTTILVGHLLCSLNSMSVFLTLQKAYNRQRKQIWELEATSVKQAVTIQKMKAQLKALKPATSKKTMKAAKHEATIVKQAVTIQKMKAQLKALKPATSKKTMKAAKSMKAK